MNGEEERIKYSVGFLGLLIHGRSVSEIYEGGETNYTDLGHTHTKTGADPEIGHGG